MRKFKMGIVTLAASAAVLIPAGLANASTHSASTPAKVSGSCLALCFDIHTGNILSGNVVDVDTAAQTCPNLNVGVLSAMVVNQTSACTLTNNQTVNITRVW